MLEISILILVALAAVLIAARTVHFSQKPAAFAMVGAGYPDPTADQIWDDGRKSWGAAATASRQTCTECGKPIPFLRRPGSKTCGANCVAVRSQRLDPRGRHGVSDVVEAGASPRRSGPASAASPGRDSPLSPFPAPHRAAAGYPKHSR